MDINCFLDKCQNHDFRHACKITRDETIKRKTEVQCDYEKNFEDKKQNSVYILTYDEKIQKIGGTKNGWKFRWNSYLCGMHSTKRGRSGKCSVTNENVYNWLVSNVDSKPIDVYVWEIPPAKIIRNILGEEVEINSTIFEAYETKLIELYKKLNNGSQPLLNKNSDPKHR